jgi:hypothetical protein
VASIYRVIVIVLAPPLIKVYWSSEEIPIGTIFASVTVMGLVGKGGGGGDASATV